MSFIMDAKKRRWLMYAAALVVILLVGYFIWQHAYPPQLVTPLSQAQAETPEGVEMAAKNAHIDMLKQQLDDAAQQIAELKDREPGKVVHTVVREVVKVVEKERAAAGANFAILTDPLHPDKPVDPKKLGKLPADAPVTLNQYNVFAYKNLLRQIEITPDWAQLAQGNFKIDEAGYGVSKMITKDGKYLGFKVSYNAKHQEAKGTIQYTY